MNILQCILEYQWFIFFLSPESEKKALDKNKVLLIKSCQWFHETRCFQKSRPSSVLARQFCGFTIRMTMQEALLKNHLENKAWNSEKWRVFTVRRLAWWMFGFAFPRSVVLGLRYLLLVVSWTRTFENEICFVFFFVLHGEKPVNFTLQCKLPQRLHSCTVLPKHLRYTLEMTHAKWIAHKATAEWLLKYSGNWFLFQALSSFKHKWQLVWVYCMKDRESELGEWKRKDHAPLQTLKWPEGKAHSRSFSTYWLWRFA